MDQKELSPIYPISVALSLLIGTFLLLSLLDRCGGSYQPTEVKSDTTYIVSFDTIRIVNVQYKPQPKKVVHDTMLICRVDTAYITFEDSVFYSDTIKVKSGKVYLSELVHRNQIQSRELAVDCYNTDTIVKIEKETIIRKNALIKVIPGLFAWGNPQGFWGAGVNLQGLFADRYLVGLSYDIKNQGIQGNFGVKISLKK